MQRSIGTEIKLTRENNTSSTRKRSLILYKAGMIFFIALTLFSLSHFAFSQQKEQSAFDPETRSKDIISHLNAVIRFYRESTTQIQKVGEPNDIVYRDQAITLSSQAADLAFQSAKAEASLMTAYQHHQGITPTSTVPAEQQRIQTIKDNVEKQLNDLKTREAALDKQIAKGGRNAAVLQDQRKQIAGAIDLTDAMADALQKVVGSPGAQDTTGLASNVETLQRSIPLLNNKTAPVAAQLGTLSQARSAGISSQTFVLFELLGTEHSLDGLIKDNDDLHNQALALRAPITNILRGLVTRGQQLSQQAVDGSPESAATSGTDSKQLESITTTFKALSSASVPLSQEIIALEQSRANLTAWRSAVNLEYKSILQTLLLRLMVIVIALSAIFCAGELWTRTTNRYVHDKRRRRQLLLMRRTVVGLLSTIVLLFGFITQFDSLATFAGFITAGVAVGLQTILLSVAAYFFIIGRYGIKVGDRITIAGVTGDVIEVGLVRFYLMELAGNGIELNPSGRVAVFSNSVLFQAGSPLYKQIPGTEYAWHELTIKLSETTDYKQAANAILKAIHTVYDQYKTDIENQHRMLAEWMHTPLAAPAIESRLQFNGGTLQFWARYPVQIKHAAAADEQLTQALLRLFEENPTVKDAVASMPVLQPSVKG